MLRFFLVAMSLTPTAAGQLPALFQVTGDAPGDWFGYAVSPAGDLNGDGVPDFAVGAHQNLNGAHSPNPGYVRIYSGVDGAELRTLVGDGTNWTDGPDDHFGISMDAVGDLDGDGRTELVVGAYKDDNTGQNAGMVRVFDGATGAIVLQVDSDQNGDRLGIAVSGVADADGDGARDLLVGVYKDDNSAWNAGSARVYSSASGALLREYDGVGEGHAFGWSCRPAGDVDGDGVEDYLSGAPLSDGPGSSVGYAAVDSGATGARLLEWTGDELLDLFGHALDGLGDVDGDGVDDVAVAAIQSDLVGSATGSGYVRVLSGADGHVIHHLEGDGFYDQFGFSVRGVGDVDGDGRGDLLIGAPRGISLGQNPSGLVGYARLVSGREGVTIHTFTGDSTDDQFGAAVARVEDMDGDGFPEFLFGASEDVPGQTRSGYAKVVSGGLVLTQRYCVAAPNSAGDGALLYSLGTLSVARDDFALRASGAAPNHVGLFFYGSAAMQVPFGNGFRCVGGSTFRLGVASTGAEGVASWELDLAHPPHPAGRIDPGSTWRFQFWYRDVPAGGAFFNLSDALEATFSG